MDKKQIALLRELTAGFDPTCTPPTVGRISDGIRRPKWSVMIPTFNCAEYLRQTLESILAQDPGTELMQIEVVDDCSTMDNPEGVIREIGRGRVAFYRKSQNEGAISNFNTCIERSRGELVHILHGDDWVLPGFYETIASLASENSDCNLYATRTIFVDTFSAATHISGRIPELEEGSNNCQSFFSGNQLQFAGVVVRRTFYEEQGGFLPPLVHCADWEMWIRAISKGRGIVAPVALAAYRVFDGNDTSRLVRTCENLRDTIRLNMTLAHSMENYPIVPALNNLLERATRQAADLDTGGEPDGARIAMEIAESIRQLIPLRSSLLYQISESVGRISRFLSRLSGFIARSAS